MSTKIHGFSENFFAQNAQQKKLHKIVQAKLVQKTYPRK